MEIDEVIILALVNILLGSVSYFLGGFLVAFAVCFVASIISLILIRYGKYGGKFGIYQVSPFACYVFDDKGMLASFKGTDWWEMEEPAELLTTKAKIKEYDIAKRRFKTEDKILDLDFLANYKSALNIMLEDLIPQPYNPTIHGELITGTLDSIIYNYREAELSKKYDALSLENKITLCEVMRAALATELGLNPLPKLYTLFSPSNELVIYWFAHGQPAEYFTYRTKMFFRKWKAAFWRRGFPVVEMWGFSVKEEKEVPLGSGRFVKSLVCMPIQDEKYRREKSFNTKKYAIIASALSTYTTTILKALPWIANIDIIITERDRYKEEAMVLRKGAMGIYSEIGSMSTLFFSAMGLLAKVGGSPGILSQLPEDLSKELSELLPRLNAEKSRFEKAKDALSKLTKDEDEKKRHEGAETAPATSSQSALKED